MMSEWKKSAQAEGVVNTPTTWRVRPSDLRPPLSLAEAQRAVELCEVKFAQVTEAREREPGRKALSSVWRFWREKSVEMAWCRDRLLAGEAAETLELKLMTERVRALDGQLLREREQAEARAATLERKLKTSTGLIRQREAALEVAEAQVVGARSDAAKAVGEMRRQVAGALEAIDEAASRGDSTAFGREIARRLGECLPDGYRDQWRQTDRVAIDAVVALGAEVGS